MNHGKCKNCWWYKMLHGNGICYMHTVNPGRDIEDPCYIGGESWCPDYTNREKANKRDKMKLEEWLNKLRTNK